MEQSVHTDNKRLPLAPCSPAGNPMVPTRSSLQKQLRKATAQRHSKPPPTNHRMQTRRHSLQSCGVSSQNKNYSQLTWSDRME